VAEIGHAMPDRQMVPVQLADVRQQVDAVVRHQLPGQLHHVRVRRQHLEPVLPHGIGRRLRCEGDETLDQPGAIQPAGLVLDQSDALHGGGQVHARGPVAHQELEQPFGMDPDEDPPDVEDDVADHAHLRTYLGTGITIPGSPGVMFTDTTVARGKKLNSEALAQV